MTYLSGGRTYSSAPRVPDIPLPRTYLVLYSTVLYCTVLYCTVLYCTAGSDGQYSVLYRTGRYCMRFRTVRVYCKDYVMACDGISC